MWKTHKKTIILTMFLTLLPIIAGIVFWDRLPDQMAIHFGVDNEANGYASKPMAVFGLPLIMVAMQMLCITASGKDPRKSNVDEKSKLLLLWIIPAISWVCSFVTYAHSLGTALNVGMIVGVLLGFIFMVIGNYLPKNETNHSFGIRTRWAVEDEATWRHSQRFGGYVMVVGGLLLAVVSLLYLPWVMIFLIALIAVLPIIYSYVYYSRHHKEG